MVPPCSLCGAGVRYLTARAALDRPSRKARGRRCHRTVIEEQKKTQINVFPSCCIITSADNETRHHRSLSFSTLPPLPAIAALVPIANGRDSESEPIDSNSYFQVPCILFILLPCPFLLCLGPMLLRGRTFFSVFRENLP